MPGSGTLPVNLPAILTGTITGTWFALAFYVASLVLVGTLGLRITTYARTPQPLKIPTMPAPLTREGAALRVAGEVVLFQSLFRSNKWIWLFGWMFHAGMLVAFVRHLRYVLQPVPELVVIAQPLGILAAFPLALGLLGLLARRFLVNRVRYISQPSDYLMLLLLLSIVASGMTMKFVAHTDIVMLKTFVLGLTRFDIEPLPADLPLLTHLSLVIVLMLVFPFSKLLHAPGVFFSPTRNQADDSRRRRYAGARA